MSEKRFANQLALVTGASSGIGAATARAFAAEGARLIIAARRVDRLEQMAAEMRSAHGTEVFVLELDLLKQREAMARLEALPPDWKTVDILVNNAGLSRGLDKLHEGRYDDWEEMIEVNVKGLLAVSRTVIPWMVARGKGHVINIGSIAGREVYPGGNVYCASKFAVRAINRGMAIDLVGTPIRVTTIDPALTETEFSLVRYRGDAKRAAAPYQGLRALSGEDIADAILWAASRPAHVNVSEMVIYPTAQRSATIVHRNDS
ncbi:MAG TPA: SDR family NAD(P)-dependent oxidoreductase [bacterium]|nr:SDR family NAD(P)-dependent oxidoreductase [bacterium]